MPHTRPPLSDVLAAIQTHRAYSRIFFQELYDVCPRSKYLSDAFFAYRQADNDLAKTLAQATGMALPYEPRNSPNPPPTV